jgi:hypothetical protein
MAGTTSNFQGTDQTLSITLGRTPPKITANPIKYAPELDGNKVKADKLDVPQPV